MPSSCESPALFPTIDSGWTRDDRVMESTLAAYTAKIESVVADPVTISADEVRHHFTKENLVDEVYHILDIVGQVFKHHGIEYWCTYGTLLGQVRHGGIIPWDDDADICVMLRDKHRVLDLHKVFRANGLFFYPKCCDKTKTYSDIFVKVKREGNGSTIEVDIFFCEEVEDNKVRTIARHYEDSTTYKEELYPLKEGKFGDLVVTLPAKPEAILARLFGESWMKEGSLQLLGRIAGGGLHVFERPLQRFDMKPFLGVPAVSSYKRYTEVKLSISE